MSIPFPWNKLLYPFLKLLNRKQGDQVILRPDSRVAKSNSMFHHFCIRDISGGEISFSDFKGKKVLLVNTASACGYTHQYAGLEKLYRQHRDHLVILAFPSNDFGKQEPGTAAEIAGFCKNKYHITFPVTEKIHVVGSGTHPVYQWLSGKNQNGWNEVKPTWNFSKYLVDEQGELLAFFSCKTDPLDETLTSLIGNS